MSERPHHVRVVSSYVSAGRPPVHISQGDVVTVGLHDQQWTSYVWGADQHGHGGWIPEEYLRMTGPREAVALRDYDASELTAARDERLEVLDEAGGWLRCRSAAGVVGWVPADHVETLD
jgi:hypothetical protein